MKTRQKLSLTIASTLLAMSSTAFGGNRLSDYDTNGDGTVTTAEIVAVKTADFNTADADSSADLTLAEFLNIENTIQTRRIATAFTALDTDLDSNITLAEFTASASTETAVSYRTNVFTLADANGDLGLSLTEFTELKRKGQRSGIWSFARKDSNYDQLLTLAEYTATTSVNTRSGRHGGGRRHR